MHYVSATYAKRRFAVLLEVAQNEAIVIRRRNQDVAVLVSPQEYSRLHALNVVGFQSFCDRVAKDAAASGLTENELARILAGASSA